MARSKQKRAEVSRVGAGKQLKNPAPITPEQKSINMDILKNWNIVLE
jgi:hypothetical protein